MKKNKHIIGFSVLAIYLFQSACTTDAANKAFAEKNRTEATGLTTQKAGLSKIYTQAITEFINAAYKRDKSTFDTLFFAKRAYGQPDDFPNIELPKTIGGTSIRIISPEAGQKMQQEREKLVYVNMMGWVEKEKAAFILVVFTNHGEHQYDYFIDFTYNSKQKGFELEKIEFENYVNLREQKPKRITLYTDGKYLTNQ